MAGIIYDPFQAMPLGAGTPAGWTNNGGGDVVAGTNSGPYPPHQWYFLNAAALESPVFSPVSATTLWFSFSVQGNGPEGVFLQLFAPSTLTGQQQPIMSLKQESDCTISAYVQGSPLGQLAGNTGTGTAPKTIGFSNNGIPDWHYIQLNSVLSGFGVGTQTFVQVAIDIAIDGTYIISGTVVSNSVLTSQLANIGIDQIQYTGNAIGISEIVLADKVPIVSYPEGVWTIAITSGGTGYTPSTTSITFTGGGGGAGAAATPVVSTTGTSSGQVTGALITAGGLGYTAAPAVSIMSSGTGSGATATASLVPPPLVRVPQMVVEPATLPNTAKIRIGQMVDEVATLPSTSKLRISQMVIELAAQLIRPRTPQYIKRFNAPGH